MHQGFVLSSFIYAVVVDVITELAKQVMLSELLCADDLVFISYRIEELWNKFIKWKEDIESKGRPK